MSLYPTPTRLALLREVDAGQVIYGLGPDSSGIKRQPAAWLRSATDGPRKVGATVDDMEREGWIVRPDRTAVWVLTDLGRSVLNRAGAA